MEISSLPIAISTLAEMFACCKMTRIYLAARYLATHLTVSVKYLHMLEPLKPRAERFASQQSNKPFFVAISINVCERASAPTTLKPLNVKIYYKFRQ